MKAPSRFKKSLRIKPGLKPHKFVSQDDRLGNNNYSTAKRIQIDNDWVEELNYWLNWQEIYDGKSNRI
jgi:hypothetical protein